MMRLGAHNSIAGGHHNAVAECLAIGGETLQIFCKNQRQWKAKPITEEEAMLFRRSVESAKVVSPMVHGSYLINLGHPDPAKREMSRLAFLDELHRTQALGIEHLNIHPGSHLEEDKRRRDEAAVRKPCLDRIAQAAAQCIDETKGSKVKVVFENAAGQGSNVGNSWEEVGYLVEAVGSPRVGVTVDTQHSWACGYDWVDHYDDVWDSFESSVGRKWLVAFHLNDSKQPCGARLDRHDTIGQGLLGVEFFRTLVNDRRLDGVCGILETPDGPESWRKEIALLRSLRTDEPVTASKKPKKPRKGQQRLA
jgi:deoxyribonuclease-4